VVLERKERHGVANSFNYGAMHSNADYVLYVDPHCTFQPKTVANMVKACVEPPGYDFCWGTGSVSFLTEEPWKTLLARSDQHPRVPLTFLITTRLWEQIKGIPEPPHCHMDVLAQDLLRQGIMVATVHDVCHHQTTGGLWAALRYYYSAAKSYARTARAGYAVGRDYPPVVQARQHHTPKEVAMLVSAAMSSLHALGAIEGLGLLPEGTLPLAASGVAWEATEE
jgi:hypothetical protein